MFCTLSSSEKEQHGFQTADPPPRLLAPPAKMTDTLRGRFRPPFRALNDDDPHPPPRPLPLQPSRSYHQPRGIGWARCRRGHDPSRINRQFRPLRRRCLPPALPRGGYPPDHRHDRERRRPAAAPAGPARAAGDRPGRLPLPLPPLQPCPGTRGPRGAAAAWPDLGDAGCAPRGTHRSGRRPRGLGGAFSAAGRCSGRRRIPGPVCQCLSRRLRVAGAAASRR